MKIGDMLVKEGIITEEQLSKALEVQKSKSSGKLGEILLELGYIDIDKFTLILDKQLKESGLSK